MGEPGPSGHQNRTPVPGARPVGRSHKKKHGGTRPGTSTLGGKPGWNWMEMAECEKTDPQMYYRPGKEAEWRKTRPYGVDYKEDYSKPKMHDMRVRLGGGTPDMIKS